MTWSWPTIRARRWSSPLSGRSSPLSLWSVVTIRKDIRYFGVTSSSIKTSHSRLTSTLSPKSSALARLMPSQWKGKLLGSVVDSQLLYATPVWSKAITNVTRTRMNLIRSQRSAALRGNPVLQHWFWPEHRRQTWSV